MFNSVGKTDFFSALASNRNSNESLWNTYARISSYLFRRTSHFFQRLHARETQKEKSYIAQS